MRPRRREEGRIAWLLALSFRDKHCCLLAPHPLSPYFFPWGLEEGLEMLLGGGMGTATCHGGGQSQPGALAMLVVLVGAVAVSGEMQGER